MISNVVTDAEAVRGLDIHRRLSVCLFSRTISLKQDAARISKRYIQMFHDDSLKSIYFGSKGQRSRVTENVAVVGLFTLVSADF